MQGRVGDLVLPHKDKHVGAGAALGRASTVTGCPSWNWRKSGTTPRADDVKRKPTPCGRFSAMSAMRRMMWEVTLSSECTCPRWMRRRFLERIGGLANIMPMSAGKAWSIRLGDMARESNGRSVSQLDGFFGRRCGSRL